MGYTSLKILSSQIFIEYFYKVKKSYIYKMINSNFSIRSFFNKLLSEETKERSEKTIITIGIVSFLLHLFIIGLVDFNIIHLSSTSSLLSNPIAAIYTPFSFILIYEVYLLVYYLPKSTTIYIGKQYEIMTLIIIRRIFKDLSKIDLSTNWYKAEVNLVFITDLLATIILFYLIYIFYRLNKDNASKNSIDINSIKIQKFIKLKNTFARFLIPVFLILSIYSLSHWIYESFFSISNLVIKIKDVNKIFFDDFFTILILVDVLILLYSFFVTDKFSKVIRNSGFIISTIIIKLSFGTEGILNTILILVGVLFGICILKIHNSYEKQSL